jgi:hypothetical protein
MALKVFINYRRDDSAGHAGRVYDWNGSSRNRVGDYQPISIN